MIWALLKGLLAEIAHKFDEIAHNLLTWFGRKMEAMVHGWIPLTYLARPPQSEVTHRAQEDLNPGVTMASMKYGVLACRVND